MKQAASREQFIGTWKLVTMTADLGGGRSKEPYGPTPLGYITYTDGFMHAILMNSERPNVGTPVEEFGRRSGVRRLAFIIRKLTALARHSAAMMQATAYSGEWEIHGDEVVHHVKASVLPDWIGTDLVRSYAFEQDRLTLTSKYPGGESITLVWQKV